MKNERRDADVESDFLWVPCGEHPVREPGECYYCAIDTLVDETRRLRAIEEVARKMARQIKELNACLRVWYVTNKNEDLGQIIDRSNGILILPAVVELLKEQNNG